MASRSTPKAQSTFEWFEEPNASDSEDGDAADYPLRGSDRFRRLPLELPPGFTFYLGLHHAADIATCPVPWFVSRRALVLDPATRGTTARDWPRLDRQRKTLPRALSRGAIDSAGFTELNQFGCHHVPATQYAAEACRYVDEIGGLDFAAVQDWMCEEHVLRITGQDIDRHQNRTIESYMELVSIAPHIPWAPVLQGFFAGDHERHLAKYYRQGIDLRCAPTVGVGSVCRRQGMLEADEIVRQLSGMDLKLHLFGYKFTGLPQTLRYVQSADSMAWSKAARSQWIQMPNHDHSTEATAELWQRGKVHASLQKDGPWVIRWDTRRDERDKVSSRAVGRAALEAHGYTFVRLMWTCQNCLEWALLWRNNMLALALGSARPDSVSRAYGHRPFGAETLATYREADPAEGYERVPPREAHDYEDARQRVSRAAGVIVPRRPQCRPAPGPDAPRCTPARYMPASAPPVVWPRAPRVAVEPLPEKPPRGRGRRAWRTWQPASGAPSLGVLGEGAAGLDAGRVVSLGEGAAEEVFRVGRLADLPYDDAELLYVLHLADEDDLPRSRAFATFYAELRSLPAKARAAAEAGFREAFEAHLWELCVEAVPTDATARPGKGFAGGITTPWRKLFGSGA